MLVPALLLKPTNPPSPLPSFLSLLNPSDRCRVPTALRTSHFPRFSPNPQPSIPSVPVQASIDVITAFPSLVDQVTGSAHGVWSVQLVHVFAKVERRCRAYQYHATPGQSNATPQTVLGAVHVLSQLAASLTSSGLSCQQGRTLKDFGRKKRCAIAVPFPTPCASAFIDWPSKLSLFLGVLCPPPSPPPLRK